MAGGGAAVVVPNAAARAALTITYPDGQLLLQEDTRQLFAQENGVWVLIGPSDTVATKADLNSLFPALPGLVVYVADEDQMYVRNSSAHQGTDSDWSKVGSQGTVLRVADVAELNAIPDADLDAGMLVYVDDWDGQGQFGLVRRNGNARQNTVADYQVILPNPSVGVNIVDTAADLPSTKKAGITVHTGDVYVVRYDANGDTIGRSYVWDGTLRPGSTKVWGWVPLEQRTLIKPTQAGPDAPQPLRVGDLQATTENNYRQISVWDGQAWIELFGEEQIKEWIATGSLFQGTVRETPVGGSFGLFELPTPAAGNRGMYWTWTGQPNTEVLSSASAALQAGWQRLNYSGCAAYSSRSGAACYGHLGFRWRSLLRAWSRQVVISSYDLPAGRNRRDRSVCHTFRQQIPTTTPLLPYCWMQRGLMGQ